MTQLLVCFSFINYLLFLLLHAAVLRYLLLSFGPYQAENCCVDLGALSSWYYFKKRLCPEHLKVLITTTPWLR